MRPAGIAISLMPSLLPGDEGISDSCGFAALGDLRFTWNASGISLRDGQQGGGPRQNLDQVLGQQPDLGIRLNQGGRLAASGALPRPLVVEVGEVVVDPDGWCVAEPVVDVVAFPQVAVLGGWL